PLSWGGGVRVSAQTLAIAAELATADDPPVDFCLWAYDPPTPMRRGDLRGVKKNGAQLSSEFYFYDYERLERAASFAAIAEAFAPVAEVAVEVDQAIP